MKHTYSSTLILFFLVANAKAVIPSLGDDCHFKKFQEERLSKEIATHWQRGVNSEVHDLKAERAYLREVKAQIIQCYKSSVEKDLKDCNFKNLKFDSEKTQTRRGSSEGYGWQTTKPTPYRYFLFSDTESEKELFPAKLKYLEELAEKLSECFEGKNLKSVTVAEFFDVYKTAEVLQSSADVLSNAKTLQLVKATSLTTVGYGKDQEKKYSISLNDWKLVNEDGVIHYYDTDRH